MYTYTYIRRSTLALSMPRMAKPRHHVIQFCKYAADTYLCLFLYISVSTHVYIQRRVHWHQVCLRHHVIPCKYAVDTYICLFIYIHIYIYIYIYTHTHMEEYTGIKHVSHYKAATLTLFDSANTLLIYIHVCQLYIHLYIYMYIYIHTERSTLASSMSHMSKLRHPR